MRLRGNPARVDLFVYKNEVFGFASGADERTFDVRGKPGHAGALRLRSREQHERDHSSSCGLTDESAAPQTSIASAGEFSRQSTRDIAQFDVAMVTSPQLARGRRLISMRQTTVAISSLSGYQRGSKPYSISR